jgi:hypothetical protein
MMKSLNAIQNQIEEIYGARTGLNVDDFVRPVKNFAGLGELLIEQESSGDLNLALLFDRDILAAWQQTNAGSNNSLSSNETPNLEPSQNQDHRPLSVTFEEVSHFVYLAYNHNRGRNITELEMEIQSEVDRIVLAFHGPFDVHPEARTRLLSELCDETYTEQKLGSAKRNRYEYSRRVAARFLNGLSSGDPHAWSPAEFETLRRFFHNDLGGKLLLAERS